MKKIMKMMAGIFGICLLLAGVVIGLTALKEGRKPSLTGKRKYSCGHIVYR